MSNRLLEDGSSLRLLEDGASVRLLETLFVAIPSRTAYFREPGPVVFYEPGAVSAMEDRVKRGTL